jgi:hypothetical protein
MNSPIEGATMDAETARTFFYDFLHNRTQGVIATVGPEGRPEAALMDIAVTPALDLIFETTDQTRKFANLGDRPAISFVVGWGGDETLQYDGVVEQLSGRALEEALTLYLSVFPQKLSHPEWPGNYYFRARPTWIRYSNYHPPRRIEEFRFGPDQTPQSGRGWWKRFTRPSKERQRN